MKVKSMFTMENTNLLFVFLMITLLTLSATRSYGEKLRLQDSFDSVEFENDQRPGNAHRRVQNNRGRGGQHQGEMRGQVGFNVGIQDGYPIRGPVQQPLILAPSNGRGGRGPQRFAEPQNNFQQQPTNNFRQPNNNNQGSQNIFQQPLNNFKRPDVPQHNIQRPPNNNPQLITNNFERPQNNFHGKPNNLPLPSNNFQGPPIIFAQPSNNPPIQTQSSNYSPNNGVTQQEVENKFTGNPFLPQRSGVTNQPSQIQPSSQPDTQINSPQNSHAFEPVTNEFPTTVKPSITTTTSTITINPRRTDLFSGSNLLEEDEKRNGKSVDDPDSFNDRGLFDTAPHCQSGYILVNNKCRLAV